jgi:general secretion pathway protein D
MGGMGSMIQHVDVDLTLKITPQINESDFIKMKIEEQLDEIEAMDPNLGPTTSKRKVSCTVVVRDQQPVVIGGLITDRETTGVAKVPILGDLPLIGVLFRKSTKRIEKKNLMLIIVPHIIKDPSDIRRLHEQKMTQLRKFADELATKRKEHDGKIDYRKKIGLMQRIFVAVESAAKERKLMEKAYYDNTDVDIVGPPEQHDLDYDPFSAEIDDQNKRKPPPGGGVEIEIIDLPSEAAKANRSGQGDASKSPASRTTKRAKPTTARNKKQERRKKSDRRGARK